MNMVSIIRNIVFYVDDNLDVIKDFIANATRILGRKPTINRCYGGSDAPYFSEKNIPVIIMNPYGNNWHNPDEYVEIDSLYIEY